MQNFDDSEDNNGIFMTQIVGEISKKNINNLLLEALKLLFSLLIFTVT